MLRTLKQNHVVHHWNYTASTLYVPGTALGSRGVTVAKTEHHVAGSLHSRPSVAEIALHGSLGYVDCCPSFTLTVTLGKIPSYLCFIPLTIKWNNWT